MKDFYHILGLQLLATEDAIKKAYRALSKKYHPDINPTGAEQFKNINEANSTLSDPIKRSAFDLKYKAHFQKNTASSSQAKSKVTKNTTVKSNTTTYNSSSNSNSGSTIIVNGVKINVSGNNTTTNVRVVNGKVIIETTTK